MNSIIHIDHEVKQQSSVQEVKIIWAKIYRQNRLKNTTYSKSQCFVMRWDTAQLRSKGFSQPIIDVGAILKVLLYFEVGNVDSPESCELARQQWNGWCCLLLHSISAPWSHPRSSHHQWLGSAYLVVPPPRLTYHRHQGSRYSKVSVQYIDILCIIQMYSTSLLSFLWLLDVPWVAAASWCCLFLPHVPSGCKQNCTDVASKLLRSYKSLVGGPFSHA